MKLMHEGKTLYEITTNHSMSVDEILDLMAPEDWREQVNENGCYIDNDGSEIWYEELEADRNR